MSFWGRGNNEVDEDTGYEDVEFVIADADEFGTSNNNAASMYLADGRELLDDPELLKYIMFTKDENLLLRLGELYWKGYDIPVGEDLAILDVFHRNLDLYEALARHPKTEKFILNNAFYSGNGFEIGVQMDIKDELNDAVILGYLKSYLAYQNVKPDFDEFSNGMESVGLDGGLGGDPLDEWGYNDYVKWW